MSSRYEMEKLWRREKYGVMFHSQTHYIQVRNVLKTKCTIEDVTRLIDDAKQIEPTKGSVLNTYQHMWGYFKKYATEDEKAAYKQNTLYFERDEVRADVLLRLILSLAKKYEVDYLLNSSLLISLDE
ncbi:YbgA family protein [Lentibacillus saliphilus]|uniref:YbgA family protein n=1 Tax=Lentibacillus saliphilus TaxID=2737028 RepID=UPI001C2F230A|nr:YbgA family protein [Lentibacillus saliphilus]